MELTSTPIRNSFITETVLVGRWRPQEYARKRPPPGHPSEAANLDNWPLLKDRISRPVIVRLADCAGAAKLRQVAVRS